jgi:hypothetical protein
MESDLSVTVQAGMNNYNYFLKLEEHGGTIRSEKDIHLLSFITNSA